MSDILTQIIEKRKSDIFRLGLDFGISIPKKRNRAVQPFMQEKGLILEVKRASPSKGNIAPNLDSYKTAFSYAECGAKAISCLTEQNYFKGSLLDLQNVCRAVDDFGKETGKPLPAVLRKDFLLSANEIEISYRAGADAVLLIARILEKEIFLQMAQEVLKFGMYALIEVRSDEDLEKLAFVFSQKDFSANESAKNHFVCGVNSRNLATFKIDLLQPVKIKEKICSIMGKDTKIIFESGVTTSECVSVIGAMDFGGILMGEAAAKNPSKAKKFVATFENSTQTANAKFWLEYANSLNACNSKIKICGITRAEDALLADSLGASFTGFIFSDKFPRSVLHENRLEALLTIFSKIKAKKVAVITEIESETAKKAVELVKEGVFDILQFHKIPYEKISATNAELLKIPHYFATNDVEEFKNLISKGEMRVLLDSKDLIQNICACENDTTRWIAGGITPENVCDVIKKFSPELIDVSSGIEDDGKIGIKNEQKMKDLFKI